MVTLGGVSFTTNTKFDKVIQPKKPTAIQPTYEGVAYFSWPATVIGQIITLNWEVMPTALYDSLDTLYQADTAVVLDPDDGSSSTYNVELTDFSGAYYLYDSGSSTFSHRTNVELKLLILSEVA